jgi:hypothetical protein
MSATWNTRIRYLTYIHGEWAGQTHLVLRDSAECVENIGDALRLKPLGGRVAFVFEVEINHWMVDETLSNAR